MPGAAAARAQNKLLRQELKRSAQDQARLLRLAERLTAQHEASARDVAAQRKSTRDTAKRLSALHDRVGRMEKALAVSEKTRREEARRLGWELKGIKYWSKVFEGQVQAMLRRMYLRPEELEYPHRLTAQRFRLTSQNEEDGVTWAVLQEIGTSKGRFVEIGCGANGGSSGFLATELGWAGLMVDTDAYKVERIVGQSGPGVRGAAAWVDRDNINDLLREHRMDGELDLLAIDIDGADYWVWEALEASSPRVVIIEFNSLFGPERAVVVPYDPEFDRHSLKEHGEWGRYYYGASLAALVNLGRRKGYRLVAVEPSGANAYFVRSDVAPDMPEADPTVAHRSNWQYLVHAQEAGETIYEFIDRAGLSLIDVS